MKRPSFKIIDERLESSRVDGSVQELFGFATKINSFFYVLRFCVRGFGDPRLNLYSPFGGVFHDSGSITFSNFSGWEDKGSIVGVC